MSNLTRNNSRPPKAGFHLDKSNGKLMGVCAGLAEWSGVDALIWRLGFVGAVLFGFGLPILIYIGIGLIAD
ncbi:MAG: PspC domain-containing protein [Pseudomonadota bacterium]